MKNDANNIYFQKTIWWNVKTTSVMSVILDSITMSQVEVFSFSFSFVFLHQQTTSMIFGIFSFSFSSHSHHRALLVRWEFVKTSSQCSSNEFSFLLHIRYFVETQICKKLSCINAMNESYILTKLVRLRKTFAVDRRIAVSYASWCLSWCYYIITFCSHQNKLATLSLL